MNLSEEQRKRIEENKRKALELRAKKMNADSSLSNNQPSTSMCSKTEGALNAMKKSMSFFGNKGIRSPQKLASASYTKFGRTGKESQERYHDGDASVKASCSLISQERFEVTSHFHRGMVEVFKTIRSQSYNPVNRKWSFRLSDYHILLQKLKKLEGVDCEPLPKAVLITFNKQVKGNHSEKSIPQYDLARVDSTLVNALMHFQRDGVNFSISHNGRVLIADDMGLGKTIQAICVAAYYRSDWPLLIVTPSSVRFSWREQLLRWLDGSLTRADIHVVTGSKNLLPEGGHCPPVTLISYDLLAKGLDHLLRQGFGVVIMDESHFLKNSKAARTKAAAPILKNARRAILLSGTPALSRPSELFPQVHAIDPTLFRGIHEFALRYCNAQENQWGWDYSGCSNMTELQLILEERIMIRRIKADVLSQLPSKRREMIILDPGSMKKATLDKHAKTMLQQNLRGAERRGALLQYFCETGKVKIPAVKQYIIDLLESGRKFLVFGHHMDVLNAIEQELKAKGFGYMRIDGSTPSEQRRIFCEDFQLDDSIKVALLSITAASTGINLSAASLVVFAELFWNPGVLVQAEDRVHRIGQKDSVNIQYLVAESTADDYIWPLVQTKLEVLSKAGLNRESFREADTTRLQKDNLTLLDFFKSDFLDETASSGEGCEESSTKVPVVKVHDQEEASSEKSMCAEDLDWLLDDNVTEDDGWCLAPDAKVCRVDETP